MCPWLSGKKCLSCSTARVKALLLFLLTVLSGKGRSGTKVCQDSPPEWAAGEKGFRANEKSHQAQNVSFPFWALVTKAKEVPRLGEKERLLFALCPRAPRASSLNIWPVWGRPVVSNPLKAGLFHKLSLLLKTVSSTLGFSVFWFEFPFLSWWSFAACKD